MKLLITGADSYIAQSFIEKYSKRHKITAFDSVEYDASDIKALLPVFKKKKIDAILHFSERSGKIQESDKEIEIINTIMFKNIQSLAQAYGVKKIITFSNLRELNTSQGLQGFKESDLNKYMPLDSYGISKYNITNMARYDNTVIVLRDVGLFGKGAPNSILTDLIERAAKGLDLFADNEIAMSLIYIDDYIRIINEFLLHAHPSGDYNISSDELANTFDVMKTLRKLSLNTIKVTRPEKRLELTVSNDKVNAAIGTFKFTSLRNAVNKIYKAYKDDK